MNGELTIEAIEKVLTTKLEYRNSKQSSMTKILIKRIPRSSASGRIRIDVIPRLDRGIQKKGTGFSGQARE